MRNTFENLIEKYNALAFTHLYIFGYSENGKIRAAFGTSDDLYKVCKLDKASRNGGNSLRFIPTKEQKKILDSLNGFTLCTTQEFKAMTTTSKYNSGEVFEKLVTEFFGQEWKKDFVSFTQAGDIEISGTPYQIKFERATFASEKTLERLAA